MAKGLTIRQPWAGLILGGGKNVENRRWHVSYTGPLYIHAGKAIDKFCWLAPVEPMAQGAIIGRVKLISCDLYRFTWRSPWHTPRMVGWYFEDPEILVDPIPFKGHLGLLNIPDELVVDAIYRPGMPYKSGGGGCYVPIGGNG